MENYQKRAEENLVELQQKANNAQKSSNLIVKLVVLILGVLFIVQYGIGSKAWYFVDPISMEFILIPCLLMLLCTGYWRGFLKAFVFLIKREHCTAERKAARPSGAYSHPHSRDLPLWMHTGDLLQSSEIPAVRGEKGSY